MHSIAACLMWPEMTVPRISITSTITALARISRNVISIPLIFKEVSDIQSIL